MNPRWLIAFFILPCSQFPTSSGQAHVDGNAAQLLGEYNHMIRFSSPKQL